MTVAGVPYAATIKRIPHGGGAPITMFSLTVRAPMGVLWQPEKMAVFTQSAGGAIVKRLVAFADWPRGVNDPYPVRPNDLLILTLRHPVVTTVLGSPTPTPGSFGVPVGAGRQLIQGHPVTIGTAVGVVGAVSSDGTVLLTQPLGAAPGAGATVRQTELHYSLDDADCYLGQHIEMYVRMVPYNA